MNPSTCPHCGAPIIRDEPCPRCELSLALATVVPSELARIEEPDPSTKRFGEYELLQQLGHGGMGVVYRARHLKLNRVVALKLLLLGQFSSDKAVQRFQREAQAAAALRHPNIVNIHDVGEIEGQHYFTMELVEGRSLASILRDGPLPAPLAAKYCHAIAEGMAAAHKLGIIHRDLKPSNILIDIFDQPRITDFGLAKRLDAIGDLTLTGQLLGSPNYLAPELASGHEKEAAPASDIFSIGAILYECLTGRPPFLAPTLPETLLRIRDSDPAPPRQLDPKIPRDLETICLKCLEKDPARRYASAQELAGELTRFLNDEPILARPVSIVGKAARWARRKPALAASFLLILILILILLIASPIAILRINHARQTAELNLYAADMNLASEALENHNIRGARELLEKHWPALRASALNPRPSIDLRGWEWRYLYGQCHSDELGTLFRGSAPVSTVCFSPDGTRLFAAIDDGTIRVWDFPSRRELAPFQTFSGQSVLDPLIPNHAVGVSPDGRLLAAGGPNKEIVIWDLPSRQKLATLTGHTDTIRHLDFASDSLTLASASKDGTIRLWDVRTNSFEQIAVLKHGYEAFCGAFSPDHRMIATSGMDRYVRFWDLSIPTLPRELPPAIEGAGWVWSLAFSADGKLLATSGGGLVPLWDTTTHILAGSLEASSSAILEIIFSGDGRKVAAAAHDLNISVWNRNQPRDRLILQGHEKEIFSLSFSRDGNTLASGSRDGTVKLWDVSSFEPKGTSWPFKDWIGQVVFSPNGKFLAGACAGNREQVKLWDLEGDREIAKATLPQTIGINASFSEDSRMLAIEGQGAWLLKIPSLEIVTNFAASTVTFSPKGNFLVVVRDHQVIRHDPASGAEIVLGALAQGNVWKSVISPDGQTAAIAANDLGPIITLWHTSRPGPPTVLRGHTESLIFGLAFSPDSRLLASHGFNGRVGLWNARNGRNLAMFPAHPGGAWAIAFAPDGKTLLSSSDDSTIKFWNLATLQEAGSIHGHQDAISTIGFSPDGNHLASGGGRMVRFWDAPTFDEIDQKKKARK